ncbi:MAG: HAD family phosphatase [Prolixibacteraceae bacterium]|nr:HAD family phosphatase [Prolixibacteraceae bacterium]
MKIDLKGIKNIIFDLGGVILDLDFMASVKAFRKMGFTYDMFDGQLGFSDDIFYHIQTGKISPKEFRNRVREILKNSNLTDQQINDAWCAMLDGIPVSRIETIRKLKNKYKVYLFSNTNLIHIERLEKEFAEENGFSFTSIFADVFYSHEIRDAKPAVSSFQKVIEMAKIDPAESIFIDDVEENIKGAEKAGLKTFWLKKGLELGEVFKVITK